MVMRVVIFASICLIPSMSARVQPKELWNRVEIQAVPQDGEHSADIQGIAQKPFISMLSDTLEDSETETEHEVDTETASSLISRAQSSEKALASLMSKVSHVLKHEDKMLARPKEGRNHSLSSQPGSLFAGVIHSFVELPFNLSDSVPVVSSTHHILYCGVGIGSAVLFACLCCWMDWARTVLKGWPANNSFILQKASGRNQYCYRSRVIYEWEQTSETLTLFTPLPTGVKKKDLEVKIWPRHMKMGRNGKVPFIKEELFNYVAIDECTWDVLKTGELKISLQKAATEEWPCVFKAHHPDRTKQIARS